MRSKLCNLNVIRFARPRGDFFSTLRQNVDQHFESASISPAGNRVLYVKAAVIIAGYLASMFGIWWFGLPSVMGFVLCGLLGFWQSMVGFNIMHDACHGSFSKKKLVNYFFGLSMNALGSDAFMWKQKHNLVHHTFTNVEGADDDIAKSPLLRMCPQQPRYAAHRFQHIYLTFLYSISTLNWIVFKDWFVYFIGNRFNVETAKMQPLDHVVFWVTKLIYFGIYLILPAYWWGFGWAFLGFAIMHAVLGIIMSFVFQLAHVVDNVEFEHATSELTQLENEWAVHQLATTSDFAMNNQVLSWFLGGLNYQAIHHLFPLISHVHYPEVQKIVEKTCAEFGVQYNSQPTLGAAIASHFRHMKRLGQKDVYTVEDLNIGNQTRDLDELIKEEVRHD